MTFNTTTSHLSIHLPTHYTHTLSVPRITHMARPWDSVLHGVNPHAFINTNTILRPELSTGTPSVFSYHVGRNSIDRNTCNTNTNSTTRASRSIRTSANIETSVLSFKSYNHVVCMCMCFSLFYVTREFTKKIGSALMFSKFVGPFPDRFGGSRKKRYSSGVCDSPMRAAV